jgi:hypothetical protein
VPSADGGDGGGCGSCSDGGGEWPRLAPAGCCSSACSGSPWWGWGFERMGLEGGRAGARGASSPPPPAARHPRDASPRRPPRRSPHGAPSDGSHARQSSGWSCACRASTRRRAATLGGGRGTPGMPRLMSSIAAPPPPSPPPRRRAVAPPAAPLDDPDAPRSLPAGPVWLAAGAGCPTRAPDTRKAPQSAPDHVERAGLVHGGVIGLWRRVGGAGRTSGGRRSGRPGGAQTVEGGGRGPAGQARALGADPAPVEPSLSISTGYIWGYEPVLGGQAPKAARPVGGGHRRP